MMKSMRSTLLIYTCALLSIAALSACDAKSTDAASDTSEPTDVASADSESEAKAKTPSAKDEAQDPAEVERPSATSPHGGEVSHEPPLDIANLLKSEDLSALTASEISTGKLAGKAATPTYNSMRLYPKEDATYGVGLQVWKFEEDREAIDFVDQMRAQYLGVEDAPADAPTLGARAFISARAGIENYIFAPEDSANHVLAISCSGDFCKEGWTDLKPLASIIAKRVTGEEQKAAPAEAEAKEKKAPKKDVKKNVRKDVKKNVKKDAKKAAKK